MKIYCPLWGDKHLSLFSKALGLSLSWKKNRESIKGAQWLIPTEDNKSDDKIRSLILDKIDPTADIKFISLLSYSLSKNTMGKVLLDVLVEHAVGPCIKDKSPLLMATPDYIYADGSIETLKIVAGNSFCAGFPHMRVLPDILDSIQGTPANDELVALGLKHQHPSWEYSDKKAKNGVTHLGGISWTRVSDKVTAVQHYLPAPFYVNFTKKDLDFFLKKDFLFLVWDHVWPSVLIEDGRYRYLGSSDLALMLEVTDYQENIPPWNPQGKTNEDEYFRTSLHNLIFKQMIYSMRSK